jgi:hypothetical protein
MKTDRLRAIALALLVALVLALPAWAQKANTGAITGTATDPSGAALKNVQVMVTNLDLNVQQDARTNERGVYHFPYLPIGNYSVTFHAEGFAEQKHQRVEITTGFTVELNAKLSLAKNEQTVTVTDEAQLVDVENTNVLNNVNSVQLAGLPNARDVGAVQGLLPGTRVTTPDVGGSQVGNITSYTGYGISSNARTQLEGINTTEGRTSVGMYFDYGDFQEVSITTAANDASMPVPGQFINLVLKSGTNKWHGTFYQDYENSSFQGHNIDAAQVSQGLGTGSRVTEYHDTNADLSGPIKSDKLWFYTSVRNQKSGKTAPGYPVDNPTESVDNYVLVQDISEKVNWQPNENRRFSQFLQWDRKDLPIRSGTPLWSVASALKNYYSNATYETNLPAIATSVQYDQTLTPRLFFTVRFGGWGYNSDNYRTLSGGQAQQLIQYDLTSLNISGTSNTFDFIRRRIQFEPTVTYFLDHFLHTSHQLKAGFLAERETYRDKEPGFKDDVALTYKSKVGAPDFTTPYSATIFNTDYEAIDKQLHTGAYLQDQFHVGQRVTVNAGARWDYYRVFVGTQNLNPNAPFYDFFYQGATLSGKTIPVLYPNGVIPSRNLIRYPFLITPRLGVAWDVAGNGKTVVKANFGLFYGNPSPADAGGATNPLQRTSYTYSWTGLDSSGNFNTSQLGAFQSNTGGANTTVAPHIKAPLTQEASLFLERQLGKNLSLRAGYVLRRVRHDFQTVDMARTWNLYSAAKTVTDPGPDGVAGTGDDRSITVYDLAAGKLPASVYQYQTPEGNNSTYQNWEVSFNERLSRRWSAFGNFLYTFNSYLYNGVATNPNLAINSHVQSADWTAHIGGTYAVPRIGVDITPLARLQSGANLGRTNTFTGLGIGSTSILVDPVGKYRSDSLFYYDIRANKKVTFLDSRLRVDAVLDVFNIFNTNANTSQSSSTGVSYATVNGVRAPYQTFLSSTAITPPRIIRLGGRFTF